MIGQQGEASKLKHSLKEVKQYMHPDLPTIIGFFDDIDDPEIRVFMDAGKVIYFFFRKFVYLFQIFY